jgi:hypothetical protein
MWNGAVFMPLIEDTETIDPFSLSLRSSLLTAWLMKNAVSRFATNSSRQSDRLTRVEGIHVAGAAPPAMLTSPYRLPSPAPGRAPRRRRRPLTRPAETGTTERPFPRHRRDVLVEALFDRLPRRRWHSASAAMRVMVVPMPPPAPDTHGRCGSSSLRRFRLHAFICPTKYGACILKNTIPQRQSVVKAGSVSSGAIV